MLFRSGVTWNSVYKKFGTQLTTTTPTYQNLAFTPSSAQWRFETISLSSFASAQRALIKFRNISQYENFLYLDNINISEFTGVDELSQNDGFTILPNPSKDVFFISQKNLTEELISVSVSNVLGECVYAGSINKNDSNAAVDLTGLPDGIYIIHLHSKSMIFSQKIILSN